MFNKNQNESNGKKGNLNSKDTNVQTDKLPPVAPVIAKFNSNNQEKTEQKKGEMNKTFVKIDKNFTVSEIKAKFEPSHQKKQEPKQEKMEKSPTVNQVREKFDPKFQAKQQESNKKQEEDNIRSKWHPDAAKNAEIGNVKEAAKKFSPEASKQQNQDKSHKPLGDHPGVKSAVSKMEKDFSSHVEALKNNSSNTKGGQNR